MEGLGWAATFILFFDVIWVGLSYITNQATEVVPKKEEEVRRHPLAPLKTIRFWPRLTRLESLQVHF